SLGRRSPMTARSWIRNRFARPPRSQRPKGSRKAPGFRFRPAIEVLEDRLAPASFAVNAQLQIIPVGTASSSPAAARAVVFFESSVADYQVLQQGVGAETDTVVLDSSGNGLDEMAAFLAGRHDLSTIALVAHGTNGAVQLGSTILNGQGLSAYRADLAAVGSALQQGG